MEPVLCIETGAKAPPGPLTIPRVLHHIQWSGNAYPLTLSHAYRYIMYMEANRLAPGYSIAVEAIVIEKLLEVAASPRYEDKSFVRDTDANGGTAYMAKGGFHNTADYARASSGGVTKADTAAVRASMKAVGIKASVEDVDTMLMRAYRQSEGASRGALVAAERRLAGVRTEWKNKRAERVAMLRMDGLCIVCGTEHVGFDRSTCVTCNRKSTTRRAVRNAANKAVK